MNNFPFYWHRQRKSFLFHLPNGTKFQQTVFFYSNSIRQVALFFQNLMRDAVYSGFNLHN